MERTISIEEKIRRAEEIYARRQNGNQAKIATVTIKNENKKNIKLLKKMISQILLSLFIYMIVYIVQNNNYIFSNDFLNKVNEILSYDMNFVEIYENVKNVVSVKINELKINYSDNDSNSDINNNVNDLNNNINEENIGNGIGGAYENALETSNQESETEGLTQINEDNQEDETQELSQEEKDIKAIQETTTFIKPVIGTVSSKYGQRNPTTSIVPKNHTGTDIAANTGTKIVSSTDGEVILVSEEGDYGKHLKIKIGEVNIIYAHCNEIYVKQGDIVKQGDEIAEVGSTGNSTGPHLHFEIRISERTVDPQKILEL